MNPLARVIRVPVVPGGDVDRPRELAGVRPNPKSGVRALYVAAAGPFRLSGQASHWQIPSTTDSRSNHSEPARADLARERPSHA